jgi:sugar phosphate isomerase/epimerase
MVLRNAILLARLLGVPVVNGFSGLPAGAPGDSMPNWVTCPWPPHFTDMLDYQWNEVAILYWKDAEKFAADHGIKIAFEMHPGMLVYNVETMLKMCEATGPAISCNFDPSHLFWNGVDAVAAIRKLGDAICHVHGKDCYVDELNISINGCNDNKPYDQMVDRSWTIISAFRLIGYDYVISIEHEDAMMSTVEGLGKGVAMLKDVTIFEEPGEMFWA